MTDAVDVERRRIDRNGSAALRAVSGTPGSEFRAHRLRVDGIPVAFASPYLTLDRHPVSDTPDEARRRGVVDALGLLLRFSDLRLHAELSPDDVFERILFDVLEQLRCDALVPSRFRGIRLNIDTAFEAWCFDARANRVDENRMAMLVYTTTHMVRARLSSSTLPEAVDEIIEATRGHLGPVIGHALRDLPRLVDDQRTYAEPAREIARLVAEVAGDATQSRAELDAAVRRHRLVVPDEWNTGEFEIADGDMSIGSAASGAAAQGSAFESIGDYRMFTTRYDTEVAGSSLFRPDRLRQLRVQLDLMERAQAIGTPRLAQRLLALFGSAQEDDWSFGRDDGALDGRRLGQLVANPATRELFRQRRIERRSDTVVAFLIDNSGSMKTQRFRAVAVLVDTFVRALDLAGISSEVLGFTTGAWSGGRPRTDWMAAGGHEEPGRLNETMHIVYKDAASTWRRSRPSLAALCDPRHFREGLDGEALAWAHQRLTTRAEPRKVVVLISDGSPTDSATSNANRPGYLDDHLTGVADRIERLGLVELGAIGIDLDMAQYVRNSIDLDLSGTLTLRHYRALEQLFG